MYSLFQCMLPQTVCSCCGTLHFLELFTYLYTCICSPTKRTLSILITQDSESHFASVLFIISKVIGGSRGVCLVHTPPWDPILSFSHTFSPKSAHVGGPRPPTGNPGSATEGYNLGIHLRLWQLNINMFCICCVACVFQTIVP